MELFANAPGPEADEPEPLAGPARPPLAERLRPRALDEVLGQDHLTGPGGLLRLAIEEARLPSLVFWGPPGCGKTTLARIVAREINLPFAPFSAVTGGVKEVRALTAEAATTLRLMGKPTVLFVDEIHRFNKSQQDAFLPHVENGTVILLGATTENPSFELNSALLSRVQVVILQPVPPEALQQLLRRALSGPDGVGREADDEALEHVARLAGGDARQALGLLEQAALFAPERITKPDVERALEGSALRYDKTGDEHYDTISAFIKSLRGSDPDAALYYLARMIQGGEDPRFIARRLVIFASEDVGNADPMALDVAISVGRAVDFVGLPEARINLAQGVTYLALAPKSNASYQAIDAALGLVREHGYLPIPLHLKNAPTRLMQSTGRGREYRYPHDDPGGVNDQRYLPEELEQAQLYQPTERGLEQELARRLARLRRLRAGGADARDD